MKALLLVALLLSGPSVAVARDPLSVKVPELKVMPGSQASWIARHMAVNGVPSHLREFTSPLPADEVADWYQREWRELSLGEVQRHREDGGEVVLCTFGLYYASVLVSPDGQGSRGALTVSVKPDEEWVDKRTTFPLPPQSAVMSRIEALDAGRRSETVQAVTRNSFWFARDSVIDTLVRRGWTVNALPRPPGLSDTVELLHFQHQGEQAQVTFQQLGNRPGAQTQILVHWLK